MYETRDDVAVVDHVLTEMCGTGAVKSCTADLSPTRNDEVSARSREQSNQ